MHVPHRWNVHFLIMYGSFRQKAVEVAAENSRALCNKSLRCLWKMIEIALKSSRDYREKWWRLLRKVVAITAKDGSDYCEGWRCQGLCPQSLPHNPHTKGWPLHRKANLFLLFS